MTEEFQPRCYERGKSYGLRKGATDPSSAEKWRFAELSIKTLHSHRCPGLPSPAEVVAVIDLGLHRRVDHDATKGVASLATKWSGAQMKNDTSQWSFWWFVATVESKVDSDRFGANNNQRGLIHWWCGSRLLSWWQNDNKRQVVGKM